MEQEPLPGLATSGERDEPGTSGRLHLVRHGEAARDLLFDVIGALRADDPLAPVTVAVPSPLAGLSLRRSLGARAASSTCASPRWPASPSCSAHPSSRPTAVAR